MCESPWWVSVPFRGLPGRDDASNTERMVWSLLRLCFFLKASSWTLWAVTSMWRGTALCRSCQGVRFVLCLVFPMKRRNHLMHLSVPCERRDVFVPADHATVRSLHESRTQWRRLPVSSRESTCTVSMTRSLRISTTAATKPGPRSGSSCWTCSREASSPTLVSVPFSTSTLKAPC